MREQTLLAILSLFLWTPSGAVAQAVDPTIRQGVIESLPEAKMIRSTDLRNRVYDSWALELGKKGFQRIDDLPATQKSGSQALKNKTRADQVRSVTRLAIGFAKDFSDHFPAFKIDDDEVI